MQKIVQIMELLEIIPHANECAAIPEVIKKFVSYLNFAGYLSDAHIDQAVAMLASAKPFKYQGGTIDPEIVKRDLKESCAKARVGGNFNPEIFLHNFASQDYFTLDDIIDLFTFLQQSAYGRHFGAERDTLQNEVWMMQHADEFYHLAADLGVVNAILPAKLHYCGVGIMGTIATSCRHNLKFFYKFIHQQKILQQLSYDKAWILTGERELSLGLDAKEDIARVAAYFKQPLKFTQRSIGNFTREFAVGITESMLLEYLVKHEYPQLKLDILVSAIEPGHWRATGQQSANDIARLIMHKIQNQELQPDLQHDCYYFLVIAAQPAILRMATQIERAFALEKHKVKFAANLKVIAAGPSLETIFEYNISESNLLARINSELAALALERYYNARIKLHDQGWRNLRSSKVLLYAERSRRA